MTKPNIDIKPPGPPLPLSKPAAKTLNDLVHAPFDADSGTGKLITFDNEGAAEFFIVVITKAVLCQRELGLLAAQQAPGVVMLVFNVVLQQQQRELLFAELVKIYDKDIYHLARQLHWKFLDLSATIKAPYNSRTRLEHINPAFERVCEIENAGQDDWRLIGAVNKHLQLKLRILEGQNDGVFIVGKKEDINQLRESLLRMLRLYPHYLAIKVHEATVSFFSSSNYNICEVVAGYADEDATYNCIDEKSIIDNYFPSNTPGHSR